MVAQKAGDVDGDGFLDLVLVNHLSGTICVLFGNGDGTFQPPEEWEVNPAAVLLPKT